jgi:hypothetical protein
MGRNNLIKMRISFILFVLFIGINIILSCVVIVMGESSTPVCNDDFFYNDNNIPDYSQTLTSVVNLKGVFYSGKTAYAFNTYCPILYEGFYSFSLNYPGNLTFIQKLGGGSFLSGGTWTNDGKWLCCYYGDGVLVEVNPEDGGVYIVGGGGTGLNGLAYNPVNNKLFGASSDGSSGGLFEINPNTGEQTYIGSFINTAWIIGIAFDANGILYGWDVGNDSLWTIDTNTGQATLVGPLGIDIKYAQDGAFDYDTDILYLSAYTESPYYGGHLYECDEDTGNCTLIGSFDGYAELDALAIPYNWSGPAADFTWTPTLPNLDEMTLFNASDSYDSDGYITLYEWDWDNDGIFDESYMSPTVTHSWSSGGDYLVTLKVTDNSSLLGMNTKKVRVGNQPPDAPIIEGPTSGKVEVEYEYNFSLYDPDDDLMYLRVDWGTGTPEGWHGPYESGTKIGLKHTWNQAGDFTIRAQASDVFDAESEWSNFTVWITKNKAVDNGIFYQFLNKNLFLENPLNLL